MHRHWSGHILDVFQEEYRAEGTVNHQGNSRTWRERREGVRMSSALEVIASVFSFTQ